MGKKLYLDPHEQELLYNLVSYGYGLRGSSKILGMTMPTLIRIKNDHPKILDLWDKAKENLNRLRYEGKVHLHYGPKIWKPSEYRKTTSGRKPKIQG